ncbi:MAG: aminoacetone oxidase family FAD-binding enzyme, partial [Gammaproteobacteria bacterium]|nr:aminoacetone oxidase family FAD-binding enzyme [Gammaproteobacteria bacterium]
MQNTVHDVLIIGAGAAGLMCAIEAAKRGLDVLVLEKARKPGRKILISGGGRCNFTNLYVSPDAYLSANPHFCKSALSRYTPWDFIALLEEHGLSYTEKTLGQLFCDQKASAIVDMLLGECAEAGAKILCDCEISGLEKNRHFLLRTSLGDYAGKNLVVASGGPSIPKMGSSDFSQRIARQFDLKTIPFRPALVPLVFPDSLRNTVFRDLSGLSLPAIVSCNGQSFRENILITHRGLSGPAILQISSYWRKGDSLSVNLLPDLDAADYLNGQRAEHPDLQLSTALGKILPKRFAQRLCEVYIPSRALKQYSQPELEKIACLLGDWQLQPSGSEGMRTAEVS